MRGIVWFRRDLRVNDQPALAAALKECHEVIPVFVFDEPLLASRQFGAPAVNFMLSCLTDLAHSLSELGLRLSWRQGVPTEEILKLAQEVGAESVYWNRDYEPAAVERDRIVGQELSKKGVLVRTFKDHVVFEAQEIRGSTGNPLQRFGAYKARWWSRWRAEPPAITGFSRKAWSRRIIIRPPPGTFARPFRARIRNRPPVDLWRRTDSPKTIALVLGWPNPRLCSGSQSSVGRRNINPFSTFSFWHRDDTQCRT